MRISDWSSDVCSSDLVMADGPARTNRSLYGDANPIGAVPFEIKVKLLAEIDAYARAKDPRVRQVSASLGGEWQAVQILRAGRSEERRVGKACVSTVRSR